MFYRTTKVSVETVDPDSFYSFLHYLYKGRLDKEALQDGPGRYKRTLEILRTSHEYCQMDLLTECKDMLIPLVNIENAFEMFQVASEFKLQVNSHYFLQVWLLYLGMMLTEWNPGM